VSRTVRGGRPPVAYPDDDVTRPSATPAVGWSVASRAAPTHSNEDRFGADGRVFTLADGVSGLVRGGQAATVAVTAMHGHFPHDGQSLEASLFAANNAVRALGVSLNQPVGTTLSTLLVAANEAWYVSVGDTRIYLLRSAGQMEQLTRDDTAAEREGLSQGDPRYLERAARLAQSLGKKPVLDAQATRIDLPPEGCRFLMTSDGVHDYVPSKEFGETATTADPSSAVRQLVDKAVEHGSRDDATALVIDVTPG
jgi:serine/threonine protein phosphatase PrpC